MFFFLIFDKSITRLPLSVIQICNFIGALFDKSHSPSTITSHVSAISYIHKILEIFYPTSAFVVKKNSSKDATTFESHMIPMEKIIDGIRAHQTRRSGHLLRLSFNEVGPISVKKRERD